MSLQRNQKRFQMVRLNTQDNLTATGILLASAVLLLILACQGSAFLNATALPETEPESTDEPATVASEAASIGAVASIQPVTQRIQPQELIYRGAFRLPDAMKIRRGQGKWLLRQWLNLKLPEARPFGRKRGFTVPVGEWIQARGAELGPLVARQPGVAPARGGSGRFAEPRNRRCRAREVPQAPLS